MSEITPVEYEGLMASDVINATNHALKNCSLTRLVSRWLFLTVRMLGNRLQLAGTHHINLLKQAIKTHVQK